MRQEPPGIPGAAVGAGGQPIRVLPVDDGRDRFEVIDVDLARAVAFGDGFPAAGVVSRVANVPGPFRPRSLVRVALR
jgi:hypothetical protein